MASLILIYGSCPVCHSYIFRQLRYNQNGHQIVLDLPSDFDDAYLID